MKRIGDVPYGLQPADDEDLQMYKGSGHSVFHFLSRHPPSPVSRVAQAEALSYF